MPKMKLTSVALIGLIVTGGAMAQTSLPGATAVTAKGPAFVGPNGMTLYTSTKDSAGKSTCNGACAANWPPFTPSAASAAPPTGSPAMNAADWSVITRDDGTKQWAYKGKPVYTFAKDTMPADSKGDGFGNGIWHIATP